MDRNGSKWSIRICLLLGSFGKPQYVTAVSHDAEAAASHVEGVSAKAIALVTSLTTCINMFQ